MAGVLFIILIPREGYEKAIKQNNTAPTEQSNAEKKRKSFQHQESLSSDDSSTSKESKHSLDTYAVSIESDSLNRDESSNKPRKSMTRTKSYDEILIDPVKDEKRRDNIGSMDSDDFDRTMKKIARTRENEEAVEKFFNCNSEKPPLDKTTPMERVLRELIDRMRIRNASWQRVNGGNSFKISFCLEKGIRCDDTIHMLSEFGIGEKEGSSIAIVPCTLYNDKTRLKEDDETSTSTQAMFKETAWNRFIGSVRARMNVAKIVDAVKSDAAFSFDFVILLVTASILASFGLVESSTIFLSASMLISPLMGPILAATFGSVIKDKKLQYWGLLNEILGIFLCILVGFIFGIIICGIDYGFGEKNELTPEMVSRTEVHSVIVGIFVALASGAAVAIAVLSENFGSLVGVAISASLLPPAVNTGLLWSYSCVHLISNTFQLSKFNQFVSNTQYSDNQSIELLILGFISLCMTLTNVLCVFIVGKVIIRIKIEVAPVLTDEERQFWKHDVPIAREYNKTFHAEDGKKLQEEFIEYCGEGSENFKGVGAELLRQEFYPHTHTWSPLSHRFHTHRKDAVTKTSLRDLETLYKTIYGKVPNESLLHNSSLNNTEPMRIAAPMHTSAHSKHSDPIPTPKSSADNHFKFNSAPLDSINEAIQRRTTFVSIDGGNSTDEQQTNGAPYSAKRKFVVTPAGEPFI